VYDYSGEFMIILSVFAVLPAQGESRQNMLTSLEDLEAIPETKK
jgi:hypothetical protein